MLNIQCSNGNWNANPYMHGYANGLILALSVLEDKEPKFLEAPQQYLNEAEALVPSIDLLVTSSISEMNANLQKYGYTILYNPERSPKYSFIASGMQNLEFDSLFELPKLTPQNKALKSIIDRIIEQQKYRYTTPKDPVEQQKDYKPRNKPFDYESERGLPIQNYLDTRFR
jgi:hypothetical protein